MNVTALRYAPSLRGLGRQHIALDDRNGSIEIGQHSGSKKTTHARPKNDSMLTELRHGDLLTAHAQEHTPETATFFAVPV
jgi:hypothetical protein